MAIAPLGWSEAKAEVSSDDGPVAVIDGAAISGADYQQYLSAYLRSRLYHGGSPERVRELADEALDSLIRNRLLANAAVDQGIEPDLEAAEARMKALRERYSGQENWAEIEAGLPEVEQKIRIATQIQRLKDKISHVGNPSTDEVRRFYESNPTLFTQPASWDLNLVMIDVSPSGTAAEWIEARKKAEAAVARIAGGESFDEVARDASTHSSASKGGALGVLHRGQLPSEADAALAEIAVGEVTAPIRMLEGYAVFRLNARNPEQLQPFDGVRERAGKLYEQTESKRRWSEFIEGLRAAATIETFDISRYVEAVVDQR